MDGIKTENLTFYYPESDEPSLCGVSFNIKKGEFVTVCGKSGCGKTTLLRLLKPVISPHGNLRGSITFGEKSISELSEREQASQIGFVMQDPDSQIVTDKVWHELAFGAESIGVEPCEMQKRIAETALYFGIHNWLEKKTYELSGGQKQLLNLASVMVMKPQILILDEPTSRLDPLSASRFLNTVYEINREFGTTVIISEHRLEEVLPISDRVLVMDGGKIICDAPPKSAALKVYNKNPDVFMSFPTPSRVAAEFTDDIPLTVRGGREWLANYVSGKEINEIGKEERTFGSTALSVKNIWFRYDKNSEDILKGLTLDIKKGEIFSIVGANGSGKSTALSVIGGINRAYRGKCICDCKISMLPQNPRTLFTKNTVMEELYDLTVDAGNAEYIMKFCGLDKFRQRHPYDLSGGEQQRLGLAMVLLTEPDVILLDEPTKGLDFSFKSDLGELLKRLCERNKSVITVSHDIEFCARFSDRCAILFGGQLVSVGTPTNVFSDSNLYTTAAAKMSAGIICGAVLPEDILESLGKKPHKNNIETPDDKEPHEGSKPPQKPKSNFFGGIIFALLFLTVQFKLCGKYEDFRNVVFQIASIFLAFFSVVCFVPQKEILFSLPVNIKHGKRNRLSAAILLLLIPVTVLSGVYLFDDRKYYFISMLIILETLLAVAVRFEKSKPAAREIVIISAMCAIAAVGRLAFFFLPQYKPLAALVIISGIAFGSERGFMVGAASSFLSNFFLGQGPWTPWQMFAFGIIGFLSGLLFGEKKLRITRLSLCVFGFLSVFVIYGGIMNPASVLMTQPKPTLSMLIASYIPGIPMDLVHAFATVFFLYFIAEPILQKLGRIKIKYDI